ncbi:MAG: hypothetical protein CO183_00835 [Candidatus Zambryskibacteria bacterium CG_4_9_14_3_um_filter_42_9]|uniref:Peptidase M14 domain-containing protein n=1 Tax=Candidatus Zambryskibacteria bacterium CG22_combo_CG10-13_8_21_14_all_42_17 TaxID=1975118 RepID=A0A2H0BCW3_9BACT|nr:MAG: hypothetical protein COX06_02850 [Candidatus Zambryskibacteria bacterium CG22_combo_CG10-13_8_21_14_all_42_17]PJA36929.1 MAG: hypothetical protein CO183_00835 [Candidatus Zambryskibacteria bacterium CG_4_9_14_3_um_filter_42_9]
MPSGRIIWLIGVITLAGGFIFVTYFIDKDTTEIPEPVEEETYLKHEILGRSVEGREIESYTFGNGEKHLLFIGGFHGGYEWNTVLLAYQFIDYLEADPDALPENFSITVIPSANPDGLYKVVGKEGRFTKAFVSKDPETLAAGRFNARGVDLNRNFGCDWKPTSMWRNKVVSAGEKPFSEPEAVIIRDFILKYRPAAVVSWHSQSNAVYAAECRAGTIPETLDIMNIYARASGYRAIESFDSYEINGDSDSWFASENVSAITVELKTHETLEWNENLAGIKALIEYYKNK